MAGGYILRFAPFASLGSPGLRSLKPTSLPQTRQIDVYMDLARTYDAYMRYLTLAIMVNLFTLMTSAAWAQEEVDKAPAAGLSGNATILASIAIIGIVGASVISSKRSHRD